MAELSVDDVEAYTGGRLSASSDETQRLLDAALAAARSEVGWHVSPVKKGDVMVLDGPGWCQHKLRLPTMNIVKLNKITENDVELDLTNIKVSKQVPWLLVRHHGYWTHREAAIEIDVDHGFPEEQCADWRQAVLAMVSDMASVVATGRADSDLASKQVDVVTYDWNPNPGLSSVSNILQGYNVRVAWV